MPIISHPGSEALSTLESRGVLQDVPQESRSQRGLDIVVSVHTSALKMTGVLHDLIPGELLITVDHPLPEGSTVTIELRNAELHGEVVYCSAKNNRYEAQILVPECDGTGLRHAPRFTVDLPARIFAADEPESVDGRIVDISAMGLGLEMTSEVRAAEVLAIETDLNVTFAVVRYCRPLPGGTYRVGAETYHVMPKERRPPPRKRWLSVLVSALERL